MKVEFYRSARGRSPVREFIESVAEKDQARILDVLAGIERFGFDCPRVQFRQLHGKLWEIKFRAEGGGYRVAYVVLHGEVMVWLHIFKKETQKTRLRALRLAAVRMKEVLHE